MLGFLRTPGNRTANLAGARVAHGAMELLARAGRVQPKTKRRDVDVCLQGVCRLNQADNRLATGSRNGATFTDSLGQWNHIDRVALGSHCGATFADSQ